MVQLHSSSLGMPAGPDRKVERGHDGRQGVRITTLGAARSSMYCHAYAGFAVDHPVARLGLPPVQGALLSSLGLFQSLTFFHALTGN